MLADRPELKLALQTADIINMERKPKDPVLSQRQKQVKALIEKGKSIKETAAALGISENTVKKRRQALYRKLHYTGALQLMANECQ